MNIKLAVIILICVILESTLVSYPLTLMAVVLISIFRGDEAMILGFLGGLLLDLFSLRLLGVDSLYFLSLLYIGGRYRKKIYEGAFVYRFLYLFISFVIYNLLFYRRLDLLSLALTTLIGSAILLWFANLSADDKKRLAV